MILSGDILILALDHNTLLTTFLIWCQVQDVYNACLPLNWPEEVDVSETPTEPQPFYEGAFLNMLFGKLSKMLDQVCTDVWTMKNVEYVRVCTLGAYKNDRLTIEEYFT